MREGKQGQMRERWRTKGERLVQFLSSRRRGNCQVAEHGISSPRVVCECRYDASPRSQSSRPLLRILGVCFRNRVSLWDCLPQTASASAPAPSTSSSTPAAAATTSPSTATPSGMSLVELAKRAAGRKAIDDFVRDGCRLGVGSGSTIVYAIERLGERLRLPSTDPMHISKIVCVPTGFQSKQV